MTDSNNEEIWANACRQAEKRCENQAQTISELRYAGNECARVLTDIAESNQLDAIARAVVIATVARWKAAKEGR